MTAVVDIDALADDRWAELIADTSAALFSSPTWLGVLHRVYGLDFRVKALTSGDALTAGFAYSVIDDPRGRRLVSLPFCDFNDPVGVNADAWQQLTAEVFDNGEAVTIRTREHDAVSSDPRFDTQQVGVCHEIDATQDPDDAFHDFATLPKRMIRKAPKAGLCTGPSSTRTALRSFFDLHLGVRKYRHNLLAQPYALFEAIAETFFDAGNGFVVGSWCGDEFAGGCLVLLEGDTAYYKFSASHPDYRKAGVSHVTLFEGLRLAHAHGMRRFDLGRSDLEPPGLLEFKRRFRPDERPVTAHRRARSDGGSDQLGPTLQALTALLARDDVPDDVTEKGGELLYRYFA